VQAVISFSLIKDRHQEMMVDGAHFDMQPLFEYLITSLGLSEEACHRNVEISVTVGGAKLDDTL
jgi:hypothetical protein